MPKKIILIIMVGLFIVLITAYAQDYKPQINPLDFTVSVNFSGVVRGRKE
jgi:hypothetical protein